MPRLFLVCSWGWQDAGLHQHLVCLQSLSQSSGSAAGQGGTWPMFTGPHPLPHRSVPVPAGSGAWAAQARGWHRALGLASWGHLTAEQCLGTGREGQAQTSARSFSSPAHCYPQDLSCSCPQACQKVRNHPQVDAARLREASSLPACLHCSLCFQFHRSSSQGSSRTVPHFGLGALTNLFLSEG